MYKFIFTLLTDPLGLPVSPIWEYAILAVIAAVAFKIAWMVSPGGIFGSEIHWIVRIIAFCAMWTIVYVFIMGCKWVIINWVLVMGIIGAGILVVGIIVITIKLHNKQKVNYLDMKRCF